MTGQQLLRNIDSAPVFDTLYPQNAAGARARYSALVNGLINIADRPVQGSVWAAADFAVRDFPEVSGEVRLFSAPGRTELAGNHTDHNNGKVLAAAVRLDVAAAAAKRNDALVIFRSSGYPDIVIKLLRADGKPNLDADPAERGTTESLIRGIAAQFAARGIMPGGFTAVADSAVMPGAGLSSSAALEVLIAKIFDSFYGAAATGAGAVTGAGAATGAIDLAKAGWRAENDYFGKPAGLMDQIASASGGVAAIDFEEPENPVVTHLEFDPASLGFALCAVHTGGSHADLTEDYAAVPREMKAAAAFCGKSVLRECGLDDVMTRIREMRGALGDRAVLRALHYFSENRRVDEMAAALKRIGAAYEFEEKRSALGRFLGLAGESGKSSEELLQNIFSPRAPENQGIALALAVSRIILGQNGVCRVHGGGFAGTIQAYVPFNMLDLYRKEMNAVFGEGAVTVLEIRETGVTEILAE